MQTTVHLRLDRDLFEQAQRYAEARGTSVSRLVADYFQALTTAESEGSEAAIPVRDTADDWIQDLGPITRSLVGVAIDSELSEDAYYRHLEEKHLGSQES